MERPRLRDGGIKFPGDKTKPQSARWASSFVKDEELCGFNVWRIGRNIVRDRQELQYLREISSLLFNIINNSDSNL
jgi:hypothetical protein